MYVIQHSNLVATSRDVVRYSERIGMASCSTTKLGTCGFSQRLRRAATVAPCLEEVMEQVIKGKESVSEAFVSVEVGGIRLMLALFNLKCWSQSIASV